MKTLLNFFFRGMLIVLPLWATVYLVWATLSWMNTLFNDLFLSWFEYKIPGLGILTGFIVIALIGFLFTRTFAKPIVHLLEKLLAKTPLINIVYSSIQDLTEAIVGEKKKFNKPVHVEFTGSGFKRLGFITEEALEKFGLQNEIAVYCPHSYNISGNLYVVSREQVTPIQTDPTDFLRFIASGGVTKINE